MPDRADEVETQRIIPLRRSTPPPPPAARDSPDNAAHPAKRSYPPAPARVSPTQTPPARAQITSLYCPPIGLARAEACPSASQPRTAARQSFIGDLPTIHPLDA